MCTRYVSTLSASITLHSKFVVFNNYITGGVKLTLLNILSSQKLQ